MRKSKEETETTRKRIVEVASIAFRKNGIAETSLQDLMLDAGLDTKGGFYKHFDSKDEPVIEAMSFSFGQALNQMKASVDLHPREAALETVVRNQLSPRHRDGTSQECPLSALGSELSRSDDVTRGIAADGLKSYIAFIAQQINGVPAAIAKKRATAIVSAMVGGIILARIAKNTSWSNSILIDTRDFILQT